jgi:GTPase
MMMVRLGATATILHKRQVFQSDLKVAEVLVRKVPDDQQFLDIRLAVLGNMEAGKSTLLGVLTHGELDNGRGKARLNLFRHLHEIQSGRTSSISLEILGLTSQGKVVNYSTHSKAEDICEASEKLITFIDLAGHQKYLKTTVFGLTARKPDFVMLVVGANTGIGE